MYDIGPGLTLAVRVVGGSSRRSINIRMISKFARRYGWPRGSEIDATAATQRRSLNAGILRVPTTTPRGKAMRRDASKSLKNERERVERLAGRCLVLSNSRECCLGNGVDIIEHYNTYNPAFRVSHHDGRRKAASS